MQRAVFLQITEAGEVELFGPAGVSVAEVVQADGDLDEPLVELPVRAQLVKGLIILGQPSLAAKVATVLDHRDAQAAES